MSKEEDKDIKFERLEAKHKSDIERLEAKILELENEIGKRRQEIADFREYILTKENERNDFNFLSVKLKKKLFKRGKGMDYLNVADVFELSNKEAYRLMDKTVTLFPLDVEIKYIKNGNRRKKIIIWKKIK